MNERTPLPLQRSVTAGLQRALPWALFAAGLPMASLAWEAATGMPRVAVVAAMRQEWVLWVAAPLAVVVSFVFWRVVIDQLPGGDGR